MRLAPMRQRSRRRAGMTRAQHAELKRIHRAIIMVRSGAAIVRDGGTVRWYGPCQRCKKPRFLQVAHIEPQGRCPQLKYDPENALALCYACHIPFGHKHPRAFENFVVGLMGPIARQALANRADSRGPRPDFQLTRLFLMDRLHSLLPNGVDAAL